ncbi:Signal peptidase complex subunit [Tilletia horrida]|uniref:Signal peptidase subunit 3 n=1 Tax=Tilletia horrida TaxID=155126 RepID=A0AAN6GNU2_9BASI|nr:Signal peptidase complex subunit [Tilletia horrida]KAK0549866.1 Signal peptidase complex subunit [Tilletia horrida]KAK0562381.1 Signal peptidase complex subunit [Tilletia horrida]
MHSSLHRLNTITAFATSVILGLLAFIAAISYPLHKPSGTVQVNKIQVLHGKARWHMDRRAQEYAKATFDIDADFSSLFNWNTKQVFVSLAAEYVTAKHAVNQAVIWDRIVRRKQDAHVAIEGEVNKYGFKAIDKSFKNITDVTFTLKWNAMPHVGALAYGDEARTGSIKVPARALVDADGKPIKLQTLYY